MKVFNFCFIVGLLCLFFGCASVSKPIPGSGQMDKIKWGLSREEVLQNFPPSVLENVYVADHLISYSLEFERETQFGVAMPIGSEEYNYHFINNVLYKIEIIRRNGGWLKQENESYKQFIEKAIEKGEQLLGDADINQGNMFSLSIREVQKNPGKIIWYRNSDRKYLADTLVEMRLSHHGHFFTFTETYTQKM